VSSPASTTQTGAAPLPRPTQLLDDLETLLLAGVPQPDVVREARLRADGVAAAGGGGADAHRTAAVALVADVLTAVWLERRWSREEADDLLGRVAELTQLPLPLVSLRVYLATLRNPHLLALPPKLALETHMELLATLSPIREASLWTESTSDRRLVCPVHVGTVRPGRRARAVAREVLHTRGPTAAAAQGLLRGVPVLRWDAPTGVLVVRTTREERERALVFARETAATFGPLLEVADLLERNAARERSLVEASERRLVRLGFDLHDGPLQDVAALAGDARLFRDQLGLLVPADDARRLAVGRVSDLEARLVAIDRELRELAGSLESPTVLATPLPELLERELAAFRRRTEINASLDRTGRFELLTASQKHTLLRVVQESLQNASDHSGASAVHVRVVATKTHLRAEVTDDGSGFDVERTLMEAARAGRLGLVGMGERVRLLGGRFDVRSRAGGPTTVTATIPRWTPLDAEPELGVELGEAG
jgi:signal transduction histidine kinase